MSGVLSIALGVVLIIAPGAGALALLWWIGAVAILIGILTVALEGVKDRLVHGRA